MKSANYFESICISNDHKPAFLEVFDDADDLTRGGNARQPWPRVTPSSIRKAKKSMGGGSVNVVWRWTKVRKTGCLTAHTVSTEGKKGGYCFPKTGEIVVAEGGKLMWKPGAKGG